MTNSLYFEYPSTSRIRILKTNCLFCNNYPYIYRIKTKLLDFTIPRNAVIIGVGKYVYIQNQEYLNALTKFYQNAKRA